MHLDSGGVRVQFRLWSGGRLVGFGTLTCSIKISKIHVVYVSVSVGRDDCSDCSI